MSCQKLETNLSPELAARDSTLASPAGLGQKDTSQACYFLPAAQRRVIFLTVSTYSLKIYFVCVRVSDPLEL